jgi:hypothetical protein
MLRVLTIAWCTPDRRPAIGCAGAHSLRTSMAPEQGDGHQRALTRTGFLAPSSDKVEAGIAAVRPALEERDEWRFWWGATRV